MVIAAFYVIGSNVGAEPIDDVIDQEERSIVEHIDRRLTISDNGASSPQVQVDGDVTHLFWVDGKIGSQRLAWKCSNDSLSTFTADRTITAPFHYISNIDIVLGSAFPLAVVFQGQLSADAPSSIYFLYMDDDDEWSICSSISTGNTPSATTDGDSIFLLMNIIDDGEERTVLASLRSVDGAPNASILSAFPLSVTDADISFIDGSLTVALIEKGSNGLYFIRFMDNGTAIGNPTLVKDACNSNIVKLASHNGNEYILFTEGGSVKMALPWRFRQLGLSYGAGE